MESEGNNNKTNFSGNIEENSEENNNLEYLQEPLQNLSPVHESPNGSQGKGNKTSSNDASAESEVNELEKRESTSSFTDLDAKVQVDSEKYNADGSLTTEFETAQEQEEITTKHKKLKKKRADAGSVRARPATFEPVPLSILSKEGKTDEPPLGEPEDATEEPDESTIGEPESTTREPETDEGAPEATLGEPEPTEDGQPDIEESSSTDEENKESTTGSARTPSPSALHIPPPRITPPRKEPRAPVSSTAIQTGPEIEGMLLPGLIKKRMVGDLTVLGTGLTARFQQGTKPPPIILPLDFFGRLSDDDEPIPSSQQTKGKAGKIQSVDIHSSYQGPKSENPDSDRTVETHFTYGVRRNPKDSARWKIFIEGCGFSAAFHMANENAKPRKTAEPKSRRVPISFRPKKRVVVLSKATRQRLQWVADEAEEKHVERMKRSRQVTTPEVIDTSESDVAESEDGEDESQVGEGLETLEERSRESHVERMVKGRNLKFRVLPPRPSKIPSPCSLPKIKPTVYEDEKTVRMRAARKFYTKVATHKL